MAEIPRHPRLRLSEKGYTKVCALVEDRDNYQCLLCGSNYGLHHHHVVFRSGGGNDTEDNLVLLCYKCHDIYAHGYKKKAFRDQFKDYLASEKVKDWREEHQEELDRIYERYRKGKKK